MLSSLLWVFSVVFLVIGPWAVVSVRECVSGPRAVLYVLRQYGLPSKKGNELSYLNLSSSSRALLFSLAFLSLNFPSDLSP